MTDKHGVNLPWTFAVSRVAILFRISFKLAIVDYSNCARKCSSMLEIRREQASLKTQTKTLQEKLQETSCIGCGACVATCKNASWERLLSTIKSELTRSIIFGINNIPKMIIIKKRPTYFKLGISITFYACYYRFLGLA